MTNHNGIEQTDVLVIGAGPAGTVAASIIHQAGFQVRILEKQQFPRFVIGESLLPRCMESLQAAGFLEAVEKMNFQKKYGAKFVRDGEICDFNFSENFTPGWTWTWQVPRADFDQVLATEVQRMGVPVEFQTEVTDISFFPDHSITQFRRPDGTLHSVRAKFIIDASGYGRVIPRLLDLNTPSHLPSRTAIFAHIQDSQPRTDSEQNRITIVLHQRDVWIWIIPFSTGITSVGFVGDPDFFQTYSGTPEEQFRSLMATNPIVQDRFQDSAFVLPPQSLTSWSIGTKQYYGNGYALAGNVTEFLDPIFSSGVTLATVSGELCARLACSQLNGEQINWQSEYEDVLNQGIDCFRSYVNAWYDGHLQDIFFADKPLLSIQRQICSVLAGYVWDQTNPYVRHHERSLLSLAKVLMGEQNTSD